jgi:hypothetical protein
VTGCGWGGGISNTTSTSICAWLAGTVYPQRCDLSPDGRWFALLRAEALIELGRGSTYIAVSRLPWFTALVAWGTDGTWTSGVRFVDDRERWTLREPAEGDPGPLRSRYGLELRPAETFANERQRGWTETEDIPARDPRDAWDEKRVRRVTMRKRRPGADDAALIVGGRFAAFRDNRNYDPESVVRA